MFGAYLNTTYSFEFSLFNCNVEYLFMYLITIIVFLGNKMLSKETENDVETLLSMDIKLRLLDAEGVDIPEDPPPIPSDPPNYDFCYELK